jgi:hypothetical protein
MRQGNHLSIFLPGGLAIVFVIVLLVYLPRDQAIRVLSKGGEVWIVLWVIFQGFATWLFLWMANVSLAARLTFFVLTGLAAGWLYWSLGVFGLSARPARFMVWGLLLLILFSLHHYACRHE